MKKFLAVILALVMALSLVACGSSKDDGTVVFKMGIDPEFNPFSYRGDDGEFTGFDVEICSAACDLLGWELEIFPVNWDQKLIQLDANECDCIWSGVTILDSMKDGYTVSAPYYDSTQVFVVKEDSGIDSTEDLAGKKVAVQLGTSGEALLNGDLKDLADTFASVETCPDFKTGFTELAGSDENGICGVFVDLPVASKYVSENDGFKIIDENLGAEQYGIIFRKADTEMCSQMEAAVAELVANGTYAEIANKDDYAEIVNNLLFLK